MNDAAKYHNNRELPLNSENAGSAFIGKNVAIWWLIPGEGWRWQAYLPTYNCPKSDWWVGLPADIAAIAQLQQPKLCMDFSDFHGAVEEAAGRGVWTHEFVNPDRLLQEVRARQIR